MLGQKSKVSLWIVTLFTATVGIVNLISAVTPSLPDRVEWLETIFPFQVRAGAHLFAVMSGFFLLILAENLLRRKRLAWLLVIGLLIISIISNLVKGWDYEESILSCLLLGQLLWMRSTFTARSDRPSIVRGLEVLIIALLFTIIYGTLGFFWLDRHYSADFTFSQALVQTLALFFTDDNLGLKFNSRFGRFFVDSIYIIGTLSLVYSLWMLLRPVLLRDGATLKERQQATKIVERYGNSSLARFALLDDKSYFFSPSGQSVIAYVPKGRGAIALGDPIGPICEREEIILGFKKFCADNDWLPAFYQTLADDLGLYQSLNFKTLKIGEEAIVDLKTFTLKGKAGKNLRTSLNKFKKLGYQVKFYNAPIDDRLLEDLRIISNEWLEEVSGSEKKFSLGWFDENYLKDCPIAIVHDSEGNPIAFANIIGEYQRNEITIDLMRHLPSAERGTMDFLFVSMLEHFQQEGYDGFNLGLVVLSGLEENEGANSTVERGMHYLYEHLNQFYNFQGLRAYKEKFHPYWEPRYLVYPRLASLPDVVVALVRADCDDRLFDYLGTHFLSTQITSGAKKLTKFLPILISILLFTVSVWAISQQLQKYRLQDIVSSMQAIPDRYLVWAVLLTGFNYFLLTGYDTLALRYVSQPLSYLRSSLVAIISYGISNSVGFALLSGSAIRYRFYSSWGLSSIDIAHIITFCNLSFWLGLFAVGGTIFTFIPLNIPQQLNLPFVSVLPLGVVFLLIIVIYLAVCAFSKKPLKIKNFVFPHLSFELCLTQIALTSLDWMFASAVFYVLLPVPKQISFFSFFGIYLLAQITGIISNVPGGLGVFETVIITLLSPLIPANDLLGALLAYRGIYYFLPLTVSLFIFGSYELRKRLTANTEQ